MWFNRPRELVTADAARALMPDRLPYWRKLINEKIEEAAMKGGCVVEVELHGVLEDTIGRLEKDLLQRDFTVVRLAEMRTVGRRLEIRW